MLSISSSGSNAHGQLGNDSTNDAYAFQPCSFSGSNRGSMPPGTSCVVHIATGANHTLILLEKDTGERELWGCGDGKKGQLGMGYERREMSSNFERIQIPLAEAGLGHYTLKHVEATWETSYAVLASAGHSDIVVSFGSDDYGDLGVGGSNKDSREKLHVVTFDHTVPSGLTEIVSISAGQRHVIVQLRAGLSLFLVGWGLSRHGQLGCHPQTPFASSPRRIADVLPNNVVSCALGIHHTLLQVQPDSIFSLGSDRKGQLQVATQCNANHADVQSVHCTWNGSYIIVKDQLRWQILTSGSNSRSQLGWIPQNDETVGSVHFPNDVDRRQSSVTVACGSEHVLALIAYPDRLSELWGWGWNEHGNLGLGHTTDIPLPVKIDAVGVSDIWWAGSGPSWICSRIEKEPKSQT